MIVATAYCDGTRLVQATWHPDTPWDATPIRVQGGAPPLNGASLSELVRYPFETSDSPSLWSIVFRLDGQVMIERTYREGDPYVLARRERAWDGMPWAGKHPWVFEMELRSP